GAACWLGDSRHGGPAVGREIDRAKQSVSLAVDAVCEEESIGKPVVRPGPNLERPETAGRVAAAGINQDSTLPRPGRIEDVDTRVDVAEVADQQVAGKRTKRRRRNGKTRGRGEVAAKDESRVWLSTSVQIKDRYGSRPESGILLGRTSARGVGHINAPVEHLHVERDKSECLDRSRGCKCAGGEALQ